MRSELFMRELERQRPAFAKGLLDAISGRDESFKDLSEKLLTWAESTLGKKYLQTLIDGYTYFVVDVNRSQILYEKTGHYENKSFLDVYNKTYNLDDFMRFYHWGVYATTFLWGHHLKLYEYYKNDFLDLIRAEEKCNVLDLGAGSGVWNLLLLENISDAIVQAVDISETSIKLAGDMARSSGHLDRVTHTLGDALHFNSHKEYDAGISSFLLEHLESPGDLLKSLALNIKQGGYAFVTGALTAAEVDHIYEFKSESEIILLAEDAGFRVLSFRSESPLKISKSRKYLPRSMAMILQKKHGAIW